MLVCRTYVISVAFKQFLLLIAHHLSTKSVYFNFLVKRSKSQVDTHTQAKRKRYQYTSDALDKAVEDVKTNLSSLRAASQKFGVPHSTIKDRLKNKYRSSGKTTVLTPQEEDEICEWIFKMCNDGVPITKSQLLDGVKLYLDLQDNRDTVFVDNRPGRDWYERFLKRHRNVAIRISETLSKSRGKLTEGAIRNWFQRVSIQNEFSTLEL